MRQIILWLLIVVAFHCFSIADSNDIIADYAKDSCVVIANSDGVAQQLHGVFANESKIALLVNHSLTVRCHCPSSHQCLEGCSSNEIVESHWVPRYKEGASLFDGVVTFGT